MGCIFAAALADGGTDTILVDVAAPVVDRINANGVTIERGGEERRVMIPATSDAGAVGQVDAVLLFVKCYHSQAAAQLAKPLVSPATVVATLQNGWGNGDVLSAVFAPGQIAIGVTYHSGTGAGPGQVRHTNTSDAPTFIGPFHDARPSRLGDLVHALEAGGLRVAEPLSIHSEIWKKLCLNASALPTSALTGLTAGALGNHPEMMVLVDGLVCETVAVGRASGFDIDEDERLASVHATLAGAGGGKASMLQDVEAGRRTEIEVINGAVVRVARNCNMAAPLNSAMSDLIAGLETARGLR
jgi:2-dehydropantoate 2-reductase